jgi:hypothetical protein
MGIEVIKVREDAIQIKAAKSFIITRGPHKHSNVKLRSRSR